jgi:glycerophosphoryl diester phosphodiesterase
LRIIGHRGAAGLAPENTIPSFQRALDLGVDGIELDVYWLHGKLLVIHDDTLERTTDGRGALTDHSLVALRGIDAGDGAPIPFLDEVLALVGGRALVNIELKGDGTAQPVADCLRRFPDSNILVSSFKHDELARFRKIDASTRVAPLFGRKPPNLDLAQRLDAWAINISRKIVGAEVVAAAHERGFEVLVYTVNDPDEMTGFAAIGVDGIFTDYPDRVPPGCRGPGAADTSDP